MKIYAEEIKSIFAKNRTEELGYDVWENFVVPPFYDMLDLHEAKKARVILGGRGYGKTMLLRYLSHESRFSPKRHDIEDDEIKNVGLYWRVDTQWVTVMNERGYQSGIWDSAFKHLLALDLSKKILESLKSITNSNLKILKYEDICNLRFDNILSYDDTLSSSYETLLNELENKNAEFEMWINNAESKTCRIPRFLPGTNFLKTIINCIKNQIPLLSQTTYLVYIDEFENLLEYQQKIINTYIKHSESPLIFNVATKPYGFKTRQTIGEESIVDIADYRTHDLDKYLHTEDFPLFAAEVLFLNLALAKYQPVPIDLKTLRDPNLLTKRKEKTYRDKILQQIRTIFPSLNNEQLAELVFKEPTLKKALETKIRKGLQVRDAEISEDKLIRPQYPEASIVSSALIYRNNLKIEEISSEFEKLVNNEENKFSGSTNWIHNNFVGCLLSLFKSDYQICPFYAGFDTFCYLSRGNMRHFLELCHKSINLALRENDSQDIIAKPDLQATAARQTSAKFLGEIPVFGKYGNRLHAFVLRIGSVFALAHEQPSQSEPERTHFAITQGTINLSEEEETFLHAAQMWSVIFVEEETKKKDPVRQIGFEYILNPIYSPYFNISYRKKRKLEMSTNDLKVLISGTYDEVKRLLTKYTKKWKIELNETNQTLFSHLREE